MNITCLILATKWLTKNVVRNPSAGQFISWIMLRQVLSYSYILGSGYFKKMEIKCQWLLYSLEFLPGTILFLFYCFHSSVHTLVSNIFVKAGLWHLTGSPEVRRPILNLFLGQSPLKKIEEGGFYLLPTCPNFNWQIHLSCFWVTALLGSNVYQQLSRSFSGLWNQTGLLRNPTQGLNNY